MANFGLVDLEDASGVKMHGLMDVDGCRISTFGKPPEVTAKIIRNIINLKIRDDDVMFWSGGKSGKFRQTSPVLFHNWVSVEEVINLATSCKNAFSLGLSGQRRPRSACAFAQSDQGLPYSLTETFGAKNV